MVSLSENLGHYNHVTCSIDAKSGWCTENWTKMADIYADNILIALSLPNVFWFKCRKFALKGPGVNESSLIQVIALGLTMQATSHYPRATIQTNVHQDVRWHTVLLGQSNTREELGHSVIGCARTTGHGFARTTPSREQQHAVGSSKR